MKTTIAYILGLTIAPLISGIAQLLLLPLWIMFWSDNRRLGAFLFSGASAFLFAILAFWAGTLFFGWLVGSTPWLYPILLGCVFAIAGLGRVMRALAMLGQHERLTGEVADEKGSKLSAHVENSICWLVCDLLGVWAGWKWFGAV